MLTRVWPASGDHVKVGRRSATVSPLIGETRTGESIPIAETALNPRQTAPNTTLLPDRPILFMPEFPSPCRCSLAPRGRRRKFRFISQLSWWEARRKRDRHDVATGLILKTPASRLPVRVARRQAPVKRNMGGPRWVVGNTSDDASL
jgi:hypothetical protein